MIPAIDAHHHIWRQADLPWLNGPNEPRIFGDYTPIKRDYPIDEFRADLEGHGVAGSVYVQANWPSGKAVEESRWVQSVADASGWPNAIVGFADFHAADADQTLKALADIPRVRGVRQQLHWHENELCRFQPRPDVMNDASWRRGFAHMRTHGLMFELQVFASQMEDAARLAADFPETTMVLQHCGMPEDTSQAGMSAWRDGMKRLADQPNVMNKLSGLGTFIRRNDPAFIAEIVPETVEIFGAGRCIYGSNFPIEKLWTGYGPLIGAFRQALAGFSEADQRRMLHDNAVRVYAPEGIGEG